MKYLKKFENHTAYEAARQNLILPNVSLCEQENEVHYNPYVPPTIVTATFIGNDYDGTMIMGGNSAIQYFKNIYIDGVKQERVQRFYVVLSELFEVEYEYTDTATALNDVLGLEGCYSMVSLTIPNSITNIGDYALTDLPNLSSLTIQSTTPPTLGNNAFNNSTLQSLTIYVPAASVDTYKAASGWSTYASRIQAIP